MTGTTPIEPPSRVNTTSLPKPTRYASGTDSAGGPVLTPCYGSSAGLAMHFDVGETLGDRRANALERDLAGHVRHEPTRHLDFGALGNRRLDAARRTRRPHR